MKSLTLFLFGLSLLAVTALSSAEKSGCECPKCKCTAESHCGCMDGSGCKCTPDKCCYKEVSPAPSVIPQK